MSSFHIENFGCRATQADGAAIERQLMDKGLVRAAVPGEAEVIILNTCTVTASADGDARAAIRRLHRLNPTARIVVTGCYAQRAPEELAAIEGVTLVVGNSHKQQVASLATESSGFVPLQAVGQAAILIGDIAASSQMTTAAVADASSERTRANLKVQDGCNNRCSFCVIPHVRGRSRSLPLAEVLENLRALQEAGFREVVLSGINLGRWGRDLPAENAANKRFPYLLRQALEDPSTASMRLRISSVEPMDWSDELISLVATEARLCKHAHIPLQSGSESVLRRMRRRYHIWNYEERIHRIHSAMPEAAIGADVMTGFPGESEEEFEQTRSFIERLPFTYLHVFTYSARPGMPSTTLPGQVPAQTARQRTRILRALSEEKRRLFQLSFVGKQVEALTLTAQQDGATEALTSHFQKVWIEGDHAPNQILPIQVTGVEGDAMRGRP